jgi:hypothetical protein
VNRDDVVSTIRRATRERSSRNLTPPISTRRHAS